MRDGDVQSLLLGGLLAVPLVMSLIAAMWLLGRAPDLGMKQEAGAAAGHHQAKPRP